MRIVNTLQDSKQNLSNKLIGYGLWLLIAILLVTLLGSISRSKVVSAEIEAKKGVLAKIENENKELERKIAEAQSTEYIEKEIRNKLGLVKEGEVIVVLPDRETLKKMSPVLNNDEDPQPDPNWKKWLKLFL